MPRKTTRKSPSAQAPKRTNRQVSRLSKEQRAIVAKERRATTSAENKILRSSLRQLERTGVYHRRTTGRLTKWQKSHIRKLDREYKQLLDPDKFIFVQAPKGKIRKAVRERAPGMGLKASRTGVFVPRGGYSTAKLLYDPKTGDIDFRRRGRFKLGKGEITPGYRTVREYESILPIANVDEIDQNFDRIRRASELLTPLRGTETLAFIIRDSDNAGYSNQTFTSVERMIAYIAQYRGRHGSKSLRSLPEWVSFLRSVEIVKVSSGKEWFDAHPIPTPEERAAREKERNRRRYARSKYERATGRR